MKRFYVFLTLVLIIVLLPMALDYRKTHMQVVRMFLPEAPPATEMPAYIDVLDQAPDKVVIGRHEPAPATRRDDHFPKLDSTGLPVIWSLWLASYTTYEEAETLRNQLLEAGYRAYLDDITGADKSISYEVLIGPGYRPERLEAQITELKQQFKLVPRLERYVP